MGVSLNKNQISILDHAKRNQNRFYGDSNDRDLNDLVDKDFMTKRAGWDESAYYILKMGGNKK